MFPTFLERRPRRQWVRTGKRLMLGVLMGVLLVLPLAVQAQSSRVNVSQGYYTTDKVVEGSLVGVEPKSTGSVTLATSANVENLVGAVVQTNESLLSVQSSANQIQVATSGVAYALVGSGNGDVKAGDRITASATPGIGMKATAATRILGIAQTDLSKATDLQSVSSKDASGKITEVKIGRLLVQLDVSYYTGQADAGRSVIPRTLQDISQAIAGKQVSDVRIILSGFLILIALVISFILLNGAVKSSIISIGRNPLSKSAVRGELLRVLAIVAGILLVTLISVYLLLSR